MVFRYLKKLTTAPTRQLLLMDSLGAVLALTLLGSMAVWGSELMGIPKNSLYLLAAVALLLALLSAVSYHVAGTKWPVLLKAVAIANIGYCLLTIGVLYLSQQTVSIYGWVYFGIELPVIITLAMWEYRMAQKALDLSRAPSS